MAKATKQTCTTEHGIFTRNSKREYRFVNAYSRGVRETWHGTLEQAKKIGASMHYRNVYLGTYPVDN